MRHSFEHNWHWKSLGIITGLYLPFLVGISLWTGHWQGFGDPALFFMSTDGQVYKTIADYFVSWGREERPDDYWLKIRPFLFPLYLSSYRVIGIAGVQVLHVAMNVLSLWFVYQAAARLSGRNWIAIGATLVLAITPSFNFLAFHALSEPLSILLMCTFMFLLIRHVQLLRPERLWASAFIISVLLCIRPIVLPIWLAFMVYYVISLIRARDWKLGLPVLSAIPVLVQLVMSTILLGYPTLSGSGRANIDDWFFPAVYGEKEFSRVIPRNSPEAQEGKDQFPKLSDKVGYLVSNYAASVKTFTRILLFENLLAGSNFVQMPLSSTALQDQARKLLYRLSGRLNLCFAGLHVMMAGVLLWVGFSRQAWCEQRAILACYLLAILLVLPTGLASSQGDRYIVLAEPMWLVAHAALLGLVLNARRSLTPSIEHQSSPS